MRDSDLHEVTEENVARIDKDKIVPHSDDPPEWRANPENMSPYMSAYIEASESSDELNALKALDVTPNDQPITLVRCFEPSRSAYLSDWSGFRSTCYSGLIAFSGLLFGYDLGVIAGAIVFMEKDFDLNDLEKEFIVTFMLVGALCGSVVSGAAADILGRRAGLMICDVMYILGAVFLALANGVALASVGRFFLGLGVGLSSSIVPMFIAELALPQSRGWLISLNEILITLGVLLAYALDFGFSYVNQGWRLMFAVISIPALLQLVVLSFFIPESPQWLVKVGRLRAAARVLSLIRKENVAQELRLIQTTVRERADFDFKTMFACWRSLVVGLGVVAFQQFTGQPSVVYYAPLLIKEKGVVSANLSLLLTTIGIGFTKFFGAMVCTLCIDRFGRRVLLLTGIFLIFLSLLTLIGGTKVEGAWPSVIVTLVGFSMYVMGYSISFGPISWVLVSEIYPLNIRGVAMALTLGTNWGTNIIVSMSFLSLMKALGETTTFLLYASIALMAFLFVLFLVPETKGMHLEDVVYKINGYRVVEAVRRPSRASSNPNTENEESRLARSSEMSHSSIN